MKREIERQLLADPLIDADVLQNARADVRVRPRRRFAVLCAGARAGAERQRSCQ
jgi:hypothetical protein